MSYPTYADPIERRASEIGWCSECKSNINTYMKDDERLCADCGGPAMGMDEAMDRLKYDREQM